MKKIIGLAIAAVIVMVVAGGGTFAYFSDTGAATGNQITAGTLYLTLDNTKVIRLAADTDGTLAPRAGTTDEKIKLTPSGMTSGNYLSIKMTNLYDNATGYPNSGANTKLHDLNGNLLSHTASDLGLKATLMIWLTTTTNNSIAAGDIVLVPPASTNGIGTMHTWAGGDSVAAYTKSWAAYTGQTSSPLTSGSTNYAAWNNVLAATTGAMGGTPYYVHCTWAFPDSNDATDNLYQGVALSFDMYFTLATVNNPYN